MARSGPSRATCLKFRHGVALPKGAEDAAADFQHAPKDTLPVLQGEGKEVRLNLGDAWGERAPVQTFSEMFHGDAVLEVGARIPLADNHGDRGVYVVVDRRDVLSALSQEL